MKESASGKFKPVTIIASVAILLLSSVMSSQHAVLANKTIDSLKDNHVGESVPVQSWVGINLRNEYGNLSSLPVETVISRRVSFKGDYYSDTPVPWQLVSMVLWAACGYSGRMRTVPTMAGYPIVIYVSNESAVYKFLPINQSLSFWKTGDYRGLSGGYHAPIQLYIVLDTNICQEILWGNAESGTAVQNIYLMANALNLGTVCEGGTWLDRTYIHQGLGLPQNENVLYKMPLGYPLPPCVDYQNLVIGSRPSSSELPEIQDTMVSLKNALNTISSSRKWNENPITKQELSQVLWASYGYSYYYDTFRSGTHRTVPSASAYYPMRICAVNSSGVYNYVPDKHTLATVVAGDRRSAIALASGNAWASSAPLIIAMAWDDSEILTVDTTYIEAGLIAQNVFLESAAWGLITDWGKADSNGDAVKDALGLSGQAHLHPISIITVGHPSLPADLNRDGVVNILDITRVALAFDSRPWQPKWDGIADLDRNGIINIIDISIVAKSFGH